MQPINITQAQINSADSQAYPAPFSLVTTEKTVSTEACRSKTTTKYILLLSEGFYFRLFFSLLSEGFYFQVFPDYFQKERATQFLGDIKNTSPLTFMLDLLFLERVSKHWLLNQTYHV